LHELFVRSRWRSVCCGSKRRRVADVMKLLVFARVRETTYVLSEGA
jgi:hypothetical protein